MSGKFTSIIKEKYKTLSLGGPTVIWNEEAQPEQNGQESQTGYNKTNAGVLDDAATKMKGSLDSTLLELQDTIRKFIQFLMKERIEKQKEDSNWEYPKSVIDLLKNANASLTNPEPMTAFDDLSDKIKDASSRFEKGELSTSYVD